MSTFSCESCESGGQTEIVGFTTTYKTRGDCQTTRKSYKTSHSVGWVVGWKKAVFLNKQVASPSRGNCFDRANPRP